jgi:putative aldouronate transport system permease protein
MGLQSLRFSYATAVGLFKSVIAFILLVSANYTSKKINGRALF